MMPQADKHAENLVGALLANLSNTDLLSQIAILILAIGLGWALARNIERHLSNSTLVFWRAAEWKRFLAPLLALLLTVLGRAIAARWASTHLLNLAIPLLLSFFILQLALFFLRSVFVPGTVLNRLERAITWLVWGVVAIHIAGYMDDVVGFLDGVGFTIGTQRISLYSALLGVATTAISLIAALSVGRLLENRLIAASDLNGNLKAALSKIVRAVLIVLAVLIALPLVGIDITVLSVFSGALGVGLGLGLQKIASNYVSGFTILLENSIRIGDMVTVNDRYGEVTKIATRYTVIRSLDGSETVIPNETLITSAVTNHSLTTPDNMVGVPIQVAYETDLRKAEQIMLDAAHHHPDVMPQPSPVVRLTDFGDNGINLKLVVWFKHPESGTARLMSDLNWAIWDGFRQAGIEIPFPQRVVRLLKD
jgi:small-conductance mechanosensitive channel